MEIMLLVGAYLMFLLLGSFRKNKSENDPDSFLLAGRKLALFPFVAAMVTTSYGWIIGISEVYYTYGVSAWLFLSLPYTLFALFMAFILSAKIRKEETHSIPELLQKYYGNKVAKLGGIFVLILISPAMYVLMTGQILATVFPIPIWICLILALIFSSAYLYKGGFQSLAKKDAWKFLFMFGGFIITLIYLYSEYGTEPLEGLAPTKKSFHLDSHFWEIITWFLLATIVVADPAYHQRINSSKSPKVARRGLLISVLCWTFFDFLAASVALYGLGIFPALENPALVYPLLANDILPPLMGGIFILGLLATVMSTLDSFLFLSAQTLMLDLLNVKAETGKSMRIGLLAISVLTFLLLLPYLDQSALSFFFDFTPFIVSVLVPPVISVFMPKLRLSAHEVLVQMGIAILVCSVWMLVSKSYNTELSAVVPGLGIAVLFQSILVLMKKRDKGIEN